jgi:hypothetical protein
MGAVEKRKLGKSGTVEPPETRDPDFSRKAALLQRQIARIKARKRAKQQKNSALMTDLCIHYAKMAGK